ncbi:MAG TPA: PspC domain-containing protein [Bacteroidota bacterium]|nr:PspC domain-containing protein [Bacteroidota bacterium]
MCKPVPDAEPVFLFPAPDPKHFFHLIRISRVKSEKGMDQPLNTAPRKLTKSRTNRMIDGVCGGIGEYFGLDPTLIRIVWVLVTLLGGSGFILYILAMIILPTNKNLAAGPENAQMAYTEPDRKRFWGITLVLIGGFILLINLGWLADFSFWSFSHRIVFPVLLIGVGAILIFTYIRRSEDRIPAPNEPGTPAAAQPRELRKSRTDRKLFGVCGGVAKYFNTDPTIIRILYVVLVLASFGWGLLLYIILGIVMPEEKLTTISS